MQKNTTGKWIVFAFDRTTNIPKTGDAANITANLRIDGGAANAVDDTNPTELEDGFYVFDITATEANGDNIVISPESTTANIQVIGVPGAVWTTPPAFNALTVAAIQAEMEENGASILDSISDKLPTNYIMGSSVQTAKDDDIDAILVDTGTTLDGKIDTIDTILDTLKALFIIREATVVDASPSKTKFKTSLTESEPDYWNNGVIQWKVGTANDGLLRAFKDYAVANGEITLNPNSPLPVTPINGDGFYIISARAFKLAGLEAQEIRDAMKLAPTAGDPETGSIDKYLNDIEDALYNGKWVIDPTAKTLTIYKSDGITVLKIIDLTSTSAIIPTFIQGVPQ